MMLHPHDKNKPNGHTINEANRLAFLRLTAHLHETDPINFQEAFHFLMEYSILWNNRISYHLLVSFLIQLQEAKTTKSYY